MESTTIEKKKEILKKVLDSGKITLAEIEEGYKHFYTVELSGKEHVADSFKEELAIITD